MNATYIDFHTHTALSDGAYTPQQLCAMARDAEIGILALTDHNHSEDLAPLRAAYPEICFIQGAEISCLYTDAENRELEIHVVALGFDPNHPDIRAVLAHNQPDRRPYINAILDRLRLCGIDLGSYEDLRALHPDTHHIGRMLIAQLLKDRGFVSTVNEAFDIYIGAFGERRAFVPNPLHYVSMEEAVRAIVRAGGVAVLAHLYYYRLDDCGCERLLRRFKELSGPNGAMEVFYGRYTSEQHKALMALADKYHLMYSAASDFHGQNEIDTLANRFTASSCAELLRFLGFRCDPEDPAPSGN
ncbi:MAG: PHP domain-containing protein [Clostridia bacterium]|nr:PHP domain-containing protein [Clostridia bacterium]